MQKLDFSEKVKVPGGESVSVVIPFILNNVGDWSIEISAGDEYRAAFTLFVSQFFDNSYGRLLPVESDDLKLWQASSGWKIPRGRALPDEKSRRIKMSLAANECESIQLVVTPETYLRSVIVFSSEFRDERKVLPLDSVVIDKVGYVHVSQPTDGTGVIADWPDPILPQNGPCNLMPGV